jgi:hypothetical protein
MARDTRSEHTANVEMASATTTTTSKHSQAYRIGMPKQDKRKARGITAGKSYLQKLLDSIGIRS